MVVFVLRPILYWLTTQYVFTNRRIIVRSGLIARHGRDMPLSKVNNVSFDVTAGGTVIGRTTTALGSHSGTCGGGFLGEDVLLFNAATRLSINVLLVTSNQVTYVRQRQCAGLQTNQLACFTNSQRITVDPGPVWIMVDASRDSGEGQYILRVQP